MRVKQLMQKYGRLLAVIAAVVIGAAIWLVAHEVAVHKQGKAEYSTRQACSILTATIAREVGGNSLTPEAVNPVSTDTTDTTYCVYRGQSSSVSLVVRSAKNQQGVALNRVAFSSPPSGSEVVHGYGDAAYWSPSFAQFNILKHNTWYLLSVGSNTASQRTLKQSETLADKILNQL